MRIHEFVIVSHDKNENSNIIWISISIGVLQEICTQRQIHVSQVVSVHQSKYFANVSFGSYSNWCQFGSLLGHSLSL